MTSTSEQGNQSSILASKVLALSYDDNLVEYDLHTRGRRVIATRIQADNHSVCTISGVVSNRYIFIVGGSDMRLPISDVFYYDLMFQNPCNRIQGPSLNSPKYHPTLIVMDNILFAFSYCISHPVPTFHLESRPTCEYLDTDAMHIGWLSTSTFPQLPPKKLTSSRDFFIGYSVVSYAAQLSTKTLFVSFGENPAAYNQGLLSLNYNFNRDCWGDVSHDPLPFHGEGKFNGDLCYGFPCGMECGLDGFLGCYRYDNSCWVELGRFPTPGSTASIQYFHCMPNTFLMVKVLPNEHIIEIRDLLPNIGYCSTNYLYTLDVDANDFDAIVGCYYDCTVRSQRTSSLKLGQSVS